VPLTNWEDDSVRIKGSRITLDSIIQSYQLGETTEQIMDSYPSMSFANIQAAITYYLTQDANLT